MPFSGAGEVTVIVPVAAAQVTCVTATTGVGGSGLIVNLSVATESQPVKLVNVTSYEPASIYVCPFQVYGS